MSPLPRKTTESVAEEEGANPGDSDTGLPSDPEELIRAVLDHRGWTERSGQMRMVHAVGEALSQKSSSDIQVQAPVGTGKTMAYLLAALTRPGRIIVSTSTKGLQDQILESELPRLASDLKELYGYELTYSVMKGKGNYPCMKSLEALISGGPPVSEEDVLIELDPGEDLIAAAESARNIVSNAIAAGQLGQVDNENALKGFRFSDRRRLTALNPCSVRASSWWPDFVEDDDPNANALLAEHIESIARDDSCAYRAAYATALTSKIVVMNTSLVAAELTKSSFLGMWAKTPQLLVGASTLIIDEAHHAPAIFMEHMSVEINCDELIAACNSFAKGLNSWSESHAERANSLAQDVLALEDWMLENVRGSRDRRVPDKSRAGVLEQIQELRTSFLSVAVGVNAEITRQSPTETENAKDGERQSHKKRVSRALSEFYEDALDPLTEMCELLDKDERRVSQQNYGWMLHWDGWEEPEGDDDPDPISMRATPVDLSFVAQEIKQTMCQENRFSSQPRAKSASFILCSGTLSEEVGRILGAEKNHVVVDSPFDSKMVRLCVAAGLPDDPRSPEWINKAWSLTKEAINTMGGRTLILTTSKKRLEEVTEQCRTHLEFNILSQADSGARKRELVEEFMADEHSVLVGTTSFWEGIDVPGSALSLVVIDKIPFPIPGNPVVDARRWWTEHVLKDDPFMRVDVDHASTMLAQGAGRLIRSESDIGGVLILDARIATRKYGRQILRQLPRSWPFGTNIDSFIEWLEWVNPDTRKGRMPKLDPTLWEPILPKRKNVRRGRE